VTAIWLVEQGLTSHSTQFRSFRRRCFTGQMIQPTVSLWQRNAREGQCDSGRRRTVSVVVCDIKPQDDRVASFD